MAQPRVKYRIDAEDNSKRAVDSAKKNAEGLGKQLNDLGKTIKSAFAVGAIAAAGKVLKDVASDMLSAYAEQERAVSRLNAALRNNPYATGSMSRNLQDYASALQKVSVYGDELVIQQMSVLSSMNMTEDQIKNVMNAATNLASTGMISLDSAVRNIAKSFSGLSGELGEMLPSVRELTQEELRQGKAVEVITQQYNGMNEAMRNTTEGGLRAFQNAWGDLKESIGAGLSAVFNPLLQWASDFVTEITEAINKTRTLNDLAKKMAEGTITIAEKITFAEIKIQDYQRQLKTLREAADLKSENYDMVGDFGKAALKGAFDMFGGDTSLDDQILKLERQISQTAQALSNYRAQLKEQEAAEKADTPSAAAPSAAGPKHPRTVYLEALQEIEQTFKGGMNKLSEDVFSELIMEQGESWLEAFQVPAEVWARIGTDADSFFSMESVEKWRLGMIAALSDAVEKVQPQVAPGPGLGTPVSAEPGSRITSVTPATGQAAGGFAGGMGAAFANFSTMISQAANAVMGFIGPIQAIQVILNPLQVILDGIFQVIEPVITTLLQPLIGMLVIIGRTIGMMLIPTLQILSPIIDLLSDAFVWFYNKVIRPVGNAIITIGNIMYNAVVTVINLVFGIYNTLLGWLFGQLSYLSYRNLDEGHLAEIDKGDLSEAGDQYLTGTGGSGGGGTPSYSTGRNVTVNVQINTDVIVGDRRQMALWIAEEIRQAEELGLLQAV